MLIESPAYVGILAHLRPLALEMLEVSIDSEGLDSECLRKVLEERQGSGKGMPRVLYTNSSGSNPTGVTTTLKRKKEILAICREYHILIVEVIGFSQIFLFIYFFFIFYLS